MDGELSGEFLPAHEKDSRISYEYTGTEYTVYVIRYNGLCRTICHTVYSTRKEKSTSNGVLPSFPVLESGIVICRAVKNRRAPILPILA